MSLELGQLCGAQPSERVNPVAFGFSRKLNAGDSSAPDEELSRSSIYATHPEREREGDHG